MAIEEKKKHQAGGAERIVDLHIFEKAIELLTNFLNLISGVPCWIVSENGACEGCTTNVLKSSLES